MKKSLEMIRMIKLVPGLTIALLLSTAMQSVFAQTIVSGKVLDEIESPVPGVNVVIKGSTQGTVTNTEGNYTLTVGNNSDVLVYSFVGFLTQEVRVGNQSVINIQLAPDISKLDELIVVGYGTQRKRDITGAIAVVDIDEMNKSQYVNITDRLQGRVAGVTVTNTGAPGSRGDIKIRGTSFFGDNNPLYVIDGVLTDDNPNLNPADVESIQVLKDASSTAIYGSRAANGVIVITTKKGRKGPPQVSLSVNVGLQQIPKKLKVMNSAQYARIANAAHDNEGAERMEDTDNLTGIDTDWQDEVFNNEALLQDFNLSVSGGGENSLAYFNVNNTYQEGTVKGPLFDRIGIRLNTEFKFLNNKLTIGENLTVSRTRTSGEQDLQGVDFAGPPVIQSAIGMLPIISVLDDSKTSGYGFGVPGVASTFTPNPVGIRDLFKNKSESTRIMGNVFLNYKIIDGLDFRFSVGIDAQTGRAKNYWKGGQIRMTTIHRSGLTESRSQTTELFLENRLTYTKTVKKHSFSVMATYMEQEINGNFQGTEIVGGFDGDDPIFQISATTAPATAITSSGTEFTSAIRSVLGRATYNYDERYLFTFNVRRDGSSKFSEENRWGTFPSVSGGWNITNEDFFKVSFISDLKLRAGYGEVGNASIDDYQYQSLINSTATGGVNYNLGPGSVSVIGATRGDIVNRDIKWEVLKETNIGLDLTMFGGKLQIIGDYYFGNLEDLLTVVPLPETVAPGGGGDGVTLNAVSMKRSGWETAVTYRKMEGDFNFSITANAFGTNNEITQLPFGVSEFDGINSISRLGIPLGQLFILDYLGIFTSQEQINALPPGYTINGVVPQVGDANYRDTNGRDEEGNLTGQPDGRISPDDDRVIIGNPIPAVQYGLIFDGTYRNFDFQIFFQGITSRDVYNSIYSGLNNGPGENYTIDYDPYIDGAGTDPRPFISQSSPNALPSTRFMENGGYFRLKNLQIGYTIPLKQVRSLRVYVSGQNLLTSTDFNGLDPEFEGDIFSPGVDPAGYPNIRTYSVGLNLVF